MNLNFQQRLTRLEHLLKEWMGKPSTTTIAASSSGGIKASPSSQTVLYRLPASGLTNTTDARTFGGAMTTATITSVNQFDQVAVTGGDANSYFHINRQFACNKIRIRVKLKIVALGATPLIGLRTVFPGGGYSSFNNTFHFDYINLLTGVCNGSTSGDIETAHSGWSGAAVVGDIIEMELLTDYLTERSFKVTKKNSLTGEISTRVHKRSGTTSLQIHQHSGVILADGTYSLLEYEVISEEPLKPKIMVIGDSMATGIVPPPGRTLRDTLAKTTNYPVALIAGTSMEQAGASAVLEDILTHKPQYAVLFLWIDPIYLDYVNPVSPSYATWTTLFNNFIQLLTVNNIKPIITYPETWSFLDTTGSKSAMFRDYINTNFPTALKLFIPNSDVIYDYTGFHYTTATYDLIAPKIIDIIKADGGL